MDNCISWQVFLQVKSREKAERVLAQFAQAIGREITTLECDPYWKDPSVFKARFMSPIRAEEASNAVVEVLQTASAIADRWVVGAPQNYAQRQWDFSGSSLKGSVRLPGVSEVFFEASNRPQDAQLVPVLVNQTHPAVQVGGD